MQCFECDSSGPLRGHFVIPQHKGGKRTVPLCLACLGKLRRKRKSSSPGNPANLTRAARLKGAQRNKQKSLEALGSAVDAAVIRRREGDTFQQIADYLNAKKHRTQQGKKFRPTTVMRLLERRGVHRPQ